MAITLNNGVVLPDLPDGLVTEEFPYVVVAQGFEIDGDANGLIVTLVDGEYAVVSLNEKVVHVPSELLPDVGVGVSITNGGLGCRYVYSANGSATWELDDISDEATFFAAYGDSLRWANHDIMICETYNDDGIYTLTDDVYLSSSDFGDSNDPEESYEEAYSMPSDWYVSLATVTRKLSGTSGKLTPEQIESTLANVGV